MLFAVLKRVLKSRSDLKLVVMGDCLEVEKSQAYFNDAPFLKVPGRLHPVKFFTHVNLKLIP